MLPKRLATFKLSTFFLSSSLSRTSIFNLSLSSMTSITPPTLNLGKRTLSSQSPSPDSKKLKSATGASKNTDLQAEADADLIDPLDQIEGLNEEDLLVAAEAFEEEFKSSPNGTKVSKQKKVEKKSNVSASTSSTNKGDASEKLEMDENDPLYVERSTMGPEWFARMEGDMKKQSFIDLKKFLESEKRSGKKTYPPPNLVHSWSRLTPLQSVKIVVLGQDPYHGPGQACGQSFSVPKGIAVPGSLKNIYKELKDEYPNFKAPSHGCLDEWARQGVLLLNACLTVSAGQAGSHHNKGWEPFTTSVLKAIASQAAKAGNVRLHKIEGSSTSSKPSGPVKGSIQSAFAMAAKKGMTENGKGLEIKEKVTEKGKGKASSESEVASGSGSGCKGVVFLVWGKPAAKTLADAGITSKSPNVLILTSAHPSPLSAHRGFLGNGHFKKANEWLEERYGKGGGIDWNRL